MIDPEKSCNDCQAFALGENETEPQEGFCTLNPPTVVVEGDQILSILPIVHGEHSRCMQLIPLDNEDKNVPDKN